MVGDYELESKEWGTYNTNFTALTDTKNKTIWIENTNNALANSTCHEFGHFLDYISNMISYTDLFRGMYEKEKLNFVDSTRDANDYAIQSNTEYFASVFSEYCINNNSCKSCVPMTYSYINAMINNLN